MRRGRPRVLCHRARRCLIQLHNGFPPGDARILEADAALKLSHGLHQFQIITLRGTVRLARNIDGSQQPAEYQNRFGAEPETEFGIRIEDLLVLG